MKHFDIFSLQTGNPYLVVSRRPLNYLSEKIDEYAKKNANLLN